MGKRLPRLIPLTILAVCVLICILVFHRLGTDANHSATDTGVSIDTSAGDASAPKITKQPTSVTTPAGTEASVSVTATGDDLSYDWYYTDANGNAQKLRAAPSSKNSITVKMSTAQDGREIYCIISDKNGNSVTSDTVKLIVGNPLKITKQPAKTTVAAGATAKVTVTATGDDLTYTWYEKNADAKHFTQTTASKGNSYSVSMDQSADGRQLYCIITDKYGNFVQTNTVTIAMKHSFDQGVIQADPTCTAPGEMLFTCGDCGKQEIRAIQKTGHSLGNWEVYRETTAAAEGIERQSCANCSYFVERAIPKVDPVWNITVDPVEGEKYKVPVGSNGKYYLTAPTKEGYAFAGWVLDDGTVFAESGTVTSNVSVKARWEVADTDSLSKLLRRTEKGVDRIKITADILIDRPIYISHNITIYADGNYTLKRDPDYKGDLFVIGQDKNGNTAVSQQREAVLSLGGGKGTLSIDGNRDALNVKVVGSALFVSDSATLNLYDGTRIANNKKLGNDRAMDATSIATTATLEKIGGAAIVNLSATVNMYGGVIENNLVVTEATNVTDEAGVTTAQELNGCGGAVFNNGNFNMYGGTIATSEALRGGGIYNGRIAYLFAGTLKNNYSHTYGGGLSTSSSANADTFLGAKTAEDKMVFSGNRSKRAGGAMYSNTNAPIIIYGNTEFNNNVSESSGGAIYTGGPLTVRGASFNGNECAYSGGAIYHHYANPERNRRYLVLENTEFEGNRASLGAAIILSAPDHAKEMGTAAEILSCTFTENEAFKNEANNGNGGAIYVTRKSEARIADCTFTRNKAHTNAGAIAMHSESKIELPRCTFTENEGGYGGALYISSNAEINASDLRFEGNRAVKRSTGDGHGGAIYANGVAFDMENFDFIGNSADSNGGAVYMYAVELSPDTDCSFENNHAGSHGGVFYLTYRSEADGSKTGSVLNGKNLTFKGNSALAGGAISVRTDCRADIKGSTFENNAATGLNKGAEGGGAIYVGYGELVYENNVAKGNTSAGFGGVIKTLDTDLHLTNCTFEENEAVSGGALCMESNSDLVVSKSTFIKNKSTYVQSGTYDSNKGGGAITIFGATMDIDDVTFEGNESKYYGGAVLASGATVTINGKTKVTNSIGQTGAALYFKSGCTVSANDLEVSGTVGKSNGVIYQNGGTMTLNRLNAQNNTSYNGGVLYTSNAATVVSVNDSELCNNTATNNGGALLMDAANVELNNTKLLENTAKNGGAIYNQCGKLKMNTLTFEQNNATRHGGVLMLMGANHTLEQGLIFKNNSAVNGGGIFYVSEYVNADTEAVTPASLTVSDYTFSEHSAGSGGIFCFEGESTEASITGCTLTDNEASNGGVLYINKSTVSLTDSVLKDNTAKLGGAIYDMAGKLTISDLVLEGNTATNNGGAIDLIGAQLDIDESITFTKNSAKNHGGAIYVSYQTIDGTSIGGVLNVDNNSFTDHTALAGGAISIRSYCTANINNTSFVGNTVSGFADTEEGDGEGGGAIYVGYGTLNLNKVTFTENKALPTAEGGVGYGGAMTLPGATVTITDTTFDQNQAGVGGAINICNKAKLNVTNSAFTHNKSTFVQGSPTDNNRGGGAVKSSGSTLTFDNVNFDGNESEYFGGAILMSSSTVEINNGSKLQNSLGTTGATIFVKYNSTLTVNASTISNNTARSNGNIYINNATVQLNGATVTENEAPLGGVVSTTEKAKVYISGGNYSKNTAQLGGVAYLNEYTLLDTQNATYEQNQAVMNTEGGNGNGAVICTVGGTVTATGDRFADNTAAGHAGAIYVTYRTINEEKVGGILNMTDGLFENNTAVAGGAVSIRTDCSANMTGTVFNNNHATGDAADKSGGAIYCGNGTLTLSGVTLNGNESGYYGGAVASLNSTTEIKDNTIIKNSVGVTGTALYFRDGGSAVLNDVSVIDNKATDGSGVIYVTSATTLDATKLTATGNQNNHGGVFYSSGSGKITIKESTLTGNTAKNNGGAIDHRSSAVIEITDSVLSNNSAKLGGAIHSQGGGDVTLMGCEINNNTATEQGGAVYKWKAGTLKITAQSKVNNNTAKTGGAIYVDEAAKVIVEDSAVETNTATDQLGAVLYLTGKASGELKNLMLNNYVGNSSAIYVEDANATLTQVTASGNRANNGGVLYATENAVVNFEGGEYKNNTANNGGVAFATHGATVNIHNATFTENTASTNGGAIYNSGADISALGENEFSKNTATNHGGAIYIAYTKNEDNSNRGGTLTMNGGLFDTNSAMGGGAVSIRSDCQASFTGTTFIGNTVSGFADTDEGDGEGGGAIYVGYGKLSLDNTAFTANKALATDAEGSIGNGGAISMAGAEVEIIGSVFTQNEAGTGGALNLRNNTVLTAENSEFKNNVSTFGSGDNNQGGGAIKSSGSTLTFNKTVFDGNESEYYAGTILASSSTLTLENATEVKNSAGTTGGALFIKSSSTATLDNVILSGNTASNSGVIYVNGATVNLNHVTASENEAAYGGIVTTTNTAKINISGGTYAKNTAQLGGVAYIQETTILNIKDATFTENKSVKSESGSNGNGAVISIAGGTVTASGNNTFSDNVAENHGGAIYVSYKDVANTPRYVGTLTMTDGLFKENTAAAGGAISARTDCVTTLTGTKFEKNVATGNTNTLGGGAIFANNNTLTLSGVTLDGNSTAYYGGGISALGTSVTIKDGSVIKNSVGITGVAVYLRDGGKCTISDMSLIDNKEEDGNGVLYITGNGKLDVTRLTATGNTNHQGGVLYASGSATVNITDSTLKGNAAGNSGGAIDTRATGTMTLANCTITENTARKGGAIYMDSGAKVVINGGFVTKNSTANTDAGTAGDGGAILIADSSEAGTAATSLTMSSVTLESNSSANKGGALATDSASPNLLISTNGCIFRSNHSAAGGGAIALMNGNQPNATDPKNCKLVFTDSSLLNNSSNSSGGAVEIRGSTCAKFDGVNATGNTTKGSGGTFYVTSNYSRLYLDGQITESGNSGNGAFAYLYNNGYSNPPHIYTTHSSSAAWYSQIKGNTSAITFDLTTLP